MRYTLVMPWIVEHHKTECLNTCKLDVLDVDNSHTNRGFPRSVNIGIDHMASNHSDWLIIMSSAVRFGKPGGQDFIQALEQHPNHQLIEATPVYGWHLIAFSRDTIETCGRWDENLFPTGWDDIDYSIRIQQVFDLKAPISTKARIDVSDTGMAHAVLEGGVTYDGPAIAAYFVRKWGRDPNAWETPAYAYPFNNPNHDIGYWPPVTINNITGYWDRPLGKSATNLV